jgi:hypothetical protein
MRDARHVGSDAAAIATTTSTAYAALNVSGSPDLRVVRSVRL